MQSKRIISQGMKNCFALRSSDRVTFFSFWCAYLSHIHFHFTFTRAPPASRDSWSPMHVGVALRKQMRPLTCTGLLPSVEMHPRSTAAVGGGTTPGLRFEV